MLKLLNRSFYFSRWFSTVFKLLSFHLSCSLALYSIEVETFCPHTLQKKRENGVKAFELMFRSFFMCLFIVDGVIPFVSTKFDLNACLIFGPLSKTEEIYRTFTTAARSRSWKIPFRCQYFICRFNEMNDVKRIGKTVKSTYTC